MIHLPHERLSRLRAELGTLIQRRDRLEEAGQPTRSLDNLIAARRVALVRLERVAADLERARRRRIA